MADKTQLEEALEFLINEENEQAVACFHNFIVEKARSIHESLMEDDELDEEVDSDDEVTEAKDEDVTEAKDEEVTESDDEEEVTEAKDEEEVTEAKDKEVTESDDEEKVEEGMNEYFGSNDLGEEGDEMGMDDVLPDEVPAEETVEVAASDLEALQAQFDSIMTDAGLGDDMGDDYEGGDEVDLGDEVAEDRFGLEVNPFAEGEESDEEAVEEAVSHGDGVQGSQGGAGTDKTGGGTHGKNASISHNSDTGKGDGKIHETEEFDYDLTEEDFLDLEEGLKAVSVTMGGEQGHGKFAGEETNTKSPVAQKDKSDVNADPKTMISKQDEHGTYKLETAPSNDKLPHSNENNHDKAEGTPGRSEVSGHKDLKQSGDQGGEQGKKKFAGTETNTKSIIGSAGSRNEK